MSKQAVRVTVIAAGFDHIPPVKGLASSGTPAGDAPRTDIFANTTSDDFFDVGGDDDLPSFLR